MWGNMRGERELPPYQFGGYGVALVTFKPSQIEQRPILDNFEPRGRVLQFLRQNVTRGLSFQYIWRCPIEA